MKEIIDFIELEDIQKYIEETEYIKLKLRASLKDNIEKDGHKPHYDTGTDNHMMWCKYSASTLKTNDYEGGEIVIADTMYKPEKGSAIIFPSNFMFPHYVNKVTKGERYSIITWLMKKGWIYFLQKFLNVNLLQQKK